jgi:hypothetical protein
MYSILKAFDMLYDASLQEDEEKQEFMRKNSNFYFPDLKYNMRNSSKV